MSPSRTLILRLLGLQAAALIALAACSSASEIASETAPVATANTPSPASGLDASSSLAAAGVTGADASNLISGTIASTSPGHITVNTERGPLRLAVDDEVRATRVVSASRDDLKVDDNVVITGERAGDGTFTAEFVSLNQNPPGSATSTDGQPPFGGGLFRAQGGPDGQSGATQNFDPERLAEQAVASGRMTQEQADALRSRLLGTPVAGFDGTGSRPGDAGVGGAGLRGAGIQPGGTPGAGAFRAGGRVFGRVVSIDQEVLAIETNADADVVEVVLTADTRIQRVESVSPVDLPVGTVISVAAERGADGVARATSVFVGDSTISPDSRRFAP